MAEYLTDVHTSPNNILCGPTQKISVLYSRINVYNADVEAPLQKYWFLLGRVKIVERGHNNFRIALGNAESDAKFLQYLDRLDDRLHGVLEEVLETPLEKQVSYSRKVYSPITLFLGDHNCVVFDENNERIIVDPAWRRREKESTFSILVELSDVTIGDGSYWINYSARQLRRNADLDLTKCLVPSGGVRRGGRACGERGERGERGGVASVPTAPGVPGIPAPSNVPNAPKMDADDAERTGSEAPFKVSVNDLKDQILKMRTKRERILRDEEMMDTRVKTMVEDIKKFKRDGRIIDDRYKNLVASVTGA